MKPEVEARFDAQMKTEVAKFARLNRADPSQLTSFWDAVEIRMAHAGCTKGEAVQFVVDTAPHLHLKWRREEVRAAEARTPGSVVAAAKQRDDEAVAFRQALGPEGR